MKGMSKMDKEKILAKNKKDNLYLDEYEKQIQLKGRAFGLVFVLLVCIIIYFFKVAHHENYYDIMTIIWSIGLGFSGYEAYVSKSSVKFVLALFFLFLMLYYFYKFIMVGF